MILFDHKFSNTIPACHTVRHSRYTVMPPHKKQPLEDTVGNFSYHVMDLDTGKKLI